MGHADKLAVAIMVFVINFTVAIFCYHFGIGTSGGVDVLNKAVPSSVWTTILGGVGYWWSAITFQAGSGTLSFVFWFLDIIFALDLLTMLRG